MTPDARKPERLHCRTPFTSSHYSAKLAPKPRRRRRGHGPQGTEKQSGKEEAEAGQEQESRPADDRRGVRRSAAETRSHSAPAGNQKITLSPALPLSAGLPTG